MTIKQHGGIFGRNPTFSDVDAKSVTLTDSSPLLKMIDADDTDQVAEINCGFGHIDIKADINNDRGSSRITFQIDGSEVGRWDSNGNLVISNAGNGIDFSATSGTGTSELFSDYEEGTWTPSYTPTTGSFTTMTYNNQEGYYTKVGDLVYINCLISTNNSNPTGGSGVLLISGLPYTCGASADHSLAISGTVNWGGDYPLAGQVIESSSTIKFQYRTAVNGATSSLDVSDMATSTSSNRNYIRFSGCYKV